MSRQTRKNELSGLRSRLVVTKRCEDITKRSSSFSHSVEAACASQKHSRLRNAIAALAAAAGPIPAAERIRRTLSGLAERVSWGVAVTRAFQADHSRPPALPRVLRAAGYRCSQDVTDDQARSTSGGVSSSRGAAASLLKKSDEQGLIGLEATSLQSSPGEGTASSSSGPCERAAGFHFEVLYPMLRAAEHAANIETKCHSISSRIQKGVFRREDLCDWVASYHFHCELGSASLFLAMRLLDRLLVRWTKSGMPSIFSIAGVDLVKLLAAAVLRLASKFEEQYPPHTAQLADMAANAFAVEDLAFTEYMLLEQLSYRLHVPTIFHHLGWFTELVGGSDPMAVKYLAELSLRCAASSAWLPSYHAAAVVVAANQVLEMPLVTICLEAALAIDESGWRGERALEENEEGEECVEKDASTMPVSAMSKVHEIVSQIFGILAETGPGVPTYDKFSTVAFGEVSRSLRKLVRRVV